MIPAGTWILVGNATFQAGTISAILSISTTNNNLDSFYQVATHPANSGSPTINITRISTVVTNTTFYLVAQANGVSNLSSSVIQVVRVG